MLDEPVLILNRSWIPLQIADVRRGIVLLYKGVAEVVCPRTFRTYDFARWVSASTGDDTPYLQTPRFRLPVPEVLVLARFNRIVRRPIRFSRRNVLVRDNWTCQYCGRRFPERELTLEHVRPISRGGTNSWRNVVVACTACNKRKADRTPSQAGMRLLRTPREPRRLYTTRPQLRRVRATWEPFLTHPSLA